MEMEKKKCRVLDKEQCSMSAPDEDDTVAIARDRSKMSLRLFELCSCKPELEYLPLLVTEKIFRMVGIEELKALRLVSRTLRQRIEEVTTVFKCWKPKGGYQLTQDLVRLSSEVETIEGAYGAHVLGVDPDKAHLKNTFETANRYHLVHSVALLAVPLARKPRLSGSLFVGGMLVFCGTTYYHAFTEDTAVRKYTPYGGMMLILAWLSLIL